MSANRVVASAVEWGSLVAKLPATDKAAFGALKVSPGQMMI